MVDGAVGGAADDPVGAAAMVPRSVLPPASLAPGPTGEAHANSARMVDFFLGGSTNFEADRRAAEELIRVDPWSAARIRTNRAFAVRALRWCLQHGIDQVLDLGCGLSSMRSTHTVARAVRPDARVAYVDIDPVVVHHMRAAVAGLDGISVTQADLGCAAGVLAAPGVTEVLDLARPLVVLSSGAPHWVPGDLGAVTAAYRDALAPRSALVLSQRTHDALEPVSTPAAFDAQIALALGPMVLRTRAELTAAFDGFDLVEPGVVDVAFWPVTPPGRAAMSYWGGLGLRP